jgi:hypothetical protein
MAEGPRYVSATAAFSSAAAAAAPEAAAPAAEGEPDAAEPEAVMLAVKISNIWWAKAHHTMQSCAGCLLIHQQKWHHQNKTTAAVVCLQGFDEVLSALPPGSNMGNLLLELGQGMSAALGVLVSNSCSLLAYQCDAVLVCARA